jgi:energy-coupling factor transport system ATP-binding protein
VRADGPPAAVFAAHGDALAAQGVWVPGRPIAPHRAVSAPADLLVRATDVTARHRLPATSVDVRAGEIVAVTGPNGAGKSTLALMLGGLLAPTTGRVHTPGLGDSRPPHRWRAGDLVRRIGSVFQDPEHQFVTSRVVDELRLAGPPPALVDELLDRLRLTRLAQANPYTLSGGEARRLSVATALAGAPRMLVLDEPTFGQDRRTWVEMVQLLAGLRDSGHGVVAVTHDDDFVAAVADRVVTLPATSLPPPAGGAP